MGVMEMIRGQREPGHVVILGLDRHDFQVRDLQGAFTAEGIPAHSLYSIPEEVREGLRSEAGAQADRLIESHHEKHQSTARDEAEMRSALFREEHTRRVAGHLGELAGTAAALVIANGIPLEVSRDIPIHSSYKFPEPPVNHYEALVPAVFAASRNGQPVFFTHPFRHGESEGKKVADPLDLESPVLDTRFGFIGSELAMTVADEAALAADRDSLKVVRYNLFEVAYVARRHRVRKEEGPMAWLRHLATGLRTFVHSGRDEGSRPVAGEKGYRGPVERRSDRETWDDRKEARRARQIIGG